MSRLRLPDRRPNETRDMTFGGQRFTVTIGYYPDGRPGEVFTHGARTGSDLDALLDDACVVVSLLLQLGIDPGQLARSMGRAGDGVTPASLIGAAVDLLAASEMEALP